VNQEPPSILTLNLDVLDSSSISKAVMTITEAIGKLGILINNAGFIALPSPISSSDKEACRKAFEINLGGIYSGTKALLPLLLSSQTGLKTIVNLNSAAARNVRVEASAHGTSKFAVLRFTEFLVGGEVCQLSVGHALNCFRGRRRLLRVIS
jgi:NADP-dependent 3-hydroxy acid dehydrogenase YdfG